MNTFGTIGRALYARKPRGTEGSAPQRRESILIVDDNVDVIEALRQLLQGRYNVVACTSHAEAALCRIEDVKVVLLDVKMAPEDGFAIFSLLRQRSPSVRIIFNTAYPGDCAAVSRMRNLEADGCLTKGEYTTAELEAAIARALSRSSSQGART